MLRAPYLAATVVLALLALTSQGASAASCYSAFSRTQYPLCQVLDDAGTFAMHWTYQGNEITFALEVDGSWGWVALGPSEAGGMLGLDAAVVSVGSGATWSIVVSQRG